MSLLGTITADGQITDKEAEDLHHWLSANRESPLPSIQFLRTTLDQILADGKITPAERRALHLAIERVLPTDLRQAAKTARLAQEVLEKGALQERIRSEKEEERKERLRNRAVASFNFMVAGVSHEGRAEVVDKHLTAGAVVFLVREVDNQFDLNAVRIMTRDGYEIGYVPREEAAQMAHFLDAGFKQSAYCVKILQGQRAPIPVIDATFYRPEATVPGALTMQIVHRKDGVDRTVHPVSQATAPPVPRSSVSPSLKKTSSIWPEASPHQVKRPTKSAAPVWGIVLGVLFLLGMLILMSRYGLR